MVSGDAGDPVGRVGTCASQVHDGDDPLYGVVTGEVDEFGQPAEDSVVVTLAGDPLYVGLKLLDEQHRLADVRLLAPVHPAQQGGRRSGATTPPTPPRWAARCRTSR